MPTYIDSAGTPLDESDDTLVFTGYALDWDAPGDPTAGSVDPTYVRVDIERYGPGPNGLVSDQSRLVLANQPRTGLPSSVAKYAGNQHGFSVSIPVNNLAMPMGQMYIGRVCFTAVNVGLGQDRSLSDPPGST